VRSALGDRSVKLVRCGACGKAAGLASRSTVGRGRICDACVDSVGHILDDLDAFDPPPQAINEDAIRDKLRDRLLVANLIIFATALLGSFVSLRRRAADND